MDEKEMREAFEKFFKKYKKTEGDRSAWSAPWTEKMPSGANVTVNMTECPRGTVFKVFKDQDKQGELIGWEAFFSGIKDKVGEEDWDPEAFFNSMRDLT